MTEGSKKRMEEEISDYWMTHDINNNENVFSPWSFRKGVEFSQQDPDAQKELLDDAKESLESLVHGIMDLGGTSAQQFKAKQKLLDKMSDAILTLNKLRALGGGK